MVSRVCCRRPSTGPRAGHVALLWLFGLGACPRVAIPVERPQVRADESIVLVPAAGGAMARLHLRLRAVNRNRTDVRAQAVDWQLTLVESEPIRGRSSLDAVVPAGAAATLDVELRVSGERLTGLVEDLALGSGMYRVSGTVHFTSRRGDVGAVFDDAGQLRLATP